MPKVKVDVFIIPESTMEVVSSMCTTLPIRVHWNVSDHVPSIGFWFVGPVEFDFLQQESTNTLTKIRIIIVRCFFITLTIYACWLTVELSCGRWYFSKCTKRLTTEIRIAKSTHAFTVSLSDWLGLHVPTTLEFCTAPTTPHFDFMN